MTKFEFKLKDSDASYLISMLCDAKVQAEKQADKFLQGKVTRVDQANADWYRGHAQFIEHLKSTIISGASAA